MRWAKEMHNHNQSRMADQHTARMRKPCTRRTHPTIHLQDRRRPIKRQATKRPIPMRISLPHQVHLLATTHLQHLQVRHQGMRNMHRRMDLLRHTEAAFPKLLSHLRTTIGPSSRTQLCFLRLLQWAAK